MPTSFVRWCNRFIEYSFYLLLFLVPLYFTNDTSELFELNKMWVTWGLTIIIMCAWGSKMIAQKKISIQRTPLDIPLLAFLSSQFLSTIFSIDRHVSIWGYYSRFNGGFLSTLSYMLLYYAFVTNYSDVAKAHEDGTTKYSFPIRVLLFSCAILIFPIAIAISAPPASNPQGVHSTFLLISMIIAFLLFMFSFPYGFLRRIFYSTLASGLIVVLWGIPSHFGADPTCLLFRGQFDINCWTEAFYPTVRMFSTLGQPAWLAAYVSVLLPISIATLLIGRESRTKHHIQETISSLKDTLTTPSLYFLGLTFLFYLSLLYANTKGGFIAFWIGNGIFWSIIFLKKIFSPKLFLQLFFSINLLFLLTNFFVGTPLPQLNTFTYTELTAKKAVPEATSIPSTTTTTEAPTPPPAPGGMGGTDSGEIRLFVWRGAVDIWKANPLFGTGVETFAFAYYKFRPAGHNMTSEWDYLYNKAHNEYLNYLATTGIVGLGTYLFFILMYAYITFSKLFTTTLHSLKKKTMSEEMKASLPSLSSQLLVASLFSGWLTILISNFFGFSVVIINLFFFLLPAFTLILLGLLDEKKVWEFPKRDENTDEMTGGQWFGVVILVGVGLYLLMLLFFFRKADIAYALGNNLDNIQEYQKAYPELEKAVNLRPGEPIFKDEFALNNATLAALILLQENAKDNPMMQQQASQLANQAVTLNNEIITKYPNNIVFWKNRVRVFYTLSQIDPQYVPTAIEAMKKVSTLAPTDAKVLYNLGIIYRNNGNLQEARSALEKSAALKPDYRDAYFALGLTLHDLAVDKDGRIQDESLAQMAEEKLQYILDRIYNQDKEVLDTLQSWQR